MADVRADGILYMQSHLLTELHTRCRLSQSEVTEILEKTKLLDFIADNYDLYSMEGTYNNLEDIRRYINEFGYTFEIEYDSREEVEYNNNEVGLIEPTQEDVIDFAIIVFRECRKAWNVSAVELSVLIGMYNLVDFLERHFGYLNSMGILGVVEEVEEYIEERGGSIPKV